MTAATYAFIFQRLRSFVAQQRARSEVLRSGRCWGWHPRAAAAAARRRRRRRRRPLDVVVCCVPGAGQLAGQRWRSKFGRPSKLPRLGDVDPTGSYCPVPEDWLQKKFAAIVPPPTSNELWRVGLHNALPFIGFGFLDNFFMILFGDTIEMTFGTMMVLSTMAAAALGNTISDVLGIGSAWYVERMACRVGMRPPELTPIQLDMVSARIATNMGRVVGVVIGCLLGMTPLLFISRVNENENAGNEKKEKQEEKPT